MSGDYACFHCGMYVPVGGGHNCPTTRAEPQAPEDWTKPTHGSMGALFADAQKQQAADDWKPDERTVRHCLQALPDARPERASVYETAGGYKIRAERAIEALIPKPDPAKALLVEYANNSGRHERGSMIDHEDYTRWLFDTGRLKP